MTNKKSFLRAQATRSFPTTVCRIARIVWGIVLSLAGDPAYGGIGVGMFKKDDAHPPSPYKTMFITFNPAPSLIRGADGRYVITGGASRMFGGMFIPNEPHPTADCSHCLPQDYHGSPMIACCNELYCPKD